MCYSELILIREGCYRSVEAEFVHTFVEHHSDLVRIFSQCVAHRTLWTEENCDNNIS